MRSVVVTGLGAISPLGLDVPQTWAALREGRSGIGPITCMSTERLQVKIAAEVHGFEPERVLDPKQIPFMDRFTQLAVSAAGEALLDSGLELDRDVAARTATILGTSIGGQLAQDENYQRLYEQGARRLHPFVVSRVMPSASASHVSIRYGITGPSFCVTSACASAGHAIAQALAMLRAGLIDVAVTGGSEACLTLGGFKTWEALRVLTADTCRPFSRDRSGLVLGEGAAVLVLEGRDHAHARGAKIYAELLGAGASADADRVIQSSAEGGAAAMRAALADARVESTRVDYVNAHGTGTAGNDPTETESIHQALGPQAKRACVSSTKSMHGHLLGAAGAIEALATVLAIRDSMIPPTIHFTEAGEGCDLDYVPNQARAREIDVALSNSFAFGGLNSVLAFGRAD